MRPSKNRNLLSALNQFLQILEASDLYCECGEVRIMPQGHTKEESEEIADTLDAILRDLKNQEMNDKV